MTSPDSSARSPSAALACGASICPGASGGWRSSAKLDHGPDALAARKRREAFVDFVEPDAPRDELVELEAPAQVLPRQPRKIAHRPRIAVARAHDPLLAHERAPAERHFVVHVDLAQPHHLAARAHRLD